MADLFRDHFLTLARYNAWATNRLFSAIDAVSEEDYRRDVGLFFKSLHGTINHLVVGEHMLWFRRFSEGVSPKVALNEEVHTDRLAAKQALCDGTLHWAPLIESWPLARWSDVLSYTTMRGTAARLPFASTLAHVFNHGTHHRGQMTAALTHMGHECPELDMVYFLQQEQLSL
jgi:uncharacterized damage-inducible protein DinB